LRAAERGLAVTTTRGLLPMNLLPALCLLTGLIPPDAASRLAVIRPAPDFILSTQNGEPLRRSDLKGKVLLVSFIFTTCSGSAPPTTTRMAQVQEALKGAGLWKDGGVRLLTITLDPKRDTAEVLRNYMRLYDADPTSWTFLTGPPEEVERTITAWGMWTRPA